MPVDEAELYAAENRQVYLQSLVERATRQLTVSNPFLRQQVVDWELVPADHYTEHELDQLAHDGAIRYWSESMELQAQVTA